MSKSSPDSDSQVTLHDEPHPEYDYPDADVTLRSSDGTLFKVHSVIPRLASDVFAGMLALPRGSKEEPEIVELSEGADIIYAILHSIYPRRPFPAMPSFAFLSSLAIAADKYDITDVSDRIHKEMRFPLLTVPGSHLELYALACRLDWKEDARIVSQYTKPPNIENQLERVILESIDTSSLLKLLSLHRRRYLLLASLSFDDANDRDRFLHRTKCDSSAGSRSRFFTPDQTAWTAFKFAALPEIERTAPYLCEYDGRWETFWKSNPASRFLESKCQTCGSSFTNHWSTEDFMKEFKRVLSLFPKTVDDQ